MKDTIRKSYLELRKSLSADDKTKFSQSIQNEFIRSNLYKNSKKIFIYINMKDEVSTSEIISSALDDGKTVAIPVALKNRVMYFVAYDRNTNLIKSKMGVFEPIAEEANEILPDNNSVMVVPGVAFDKSGYRMGYGGGYYDTYIEKYNVKNTAALAFGVQIQNSIPYEEHDKRMKYIITENRVIGGAGL